MEHESPCTFLTERAFTNVMQYMGPRAVPGRACALMPVGHVHRGLVQNQTLTFGGSSGK